jgi:uncharacterized protein
MSINQNFEICNSLSVERKDEMSKFFIKYINIGYQFDLEASNGEIIATSGLYSDNQECLKGIVSVKKDASIAKIEDQTEDNFLRILDPKFELFFDKDGKYRFRLKSRYGDIITTSEGYEEKKSCLNDIESVIESAPAASVEIGMN